MLAPEQIYVRVKRRKQTFFIPCVADDSMLKIKEKVALALKGSDNECSEPASMRLILPSKSTILEDEKKLTDYEIKNDDILHVALQISENQWETPNVDTTDFASNAGS